MLYCNSELVSPSISVIRKNERSDSYFSWTNSSPVCFYFAEGVYVLMVTIYA